MDSDEQRKLGVIVAGDCGKFMLNRFWRDGIHMPSCWNPTNYYDYVRVDHITMKDKFDFMCMKCMVRACEQLYATLYD